MKFNLSDWMIDHINEGVLSPLDTTKPAEEEVIKYVSFRSRMSSSSLKITSAFTGRILKEKIGSISVMSPKRIHLMREIRNSRNNSTARNLNHILIDFVHFTSDYLPQVNHLLSTSFWTGIDVSESLLTPEYSIIALHNRLVVGVGLMTPDGYISYLMV